MSDEFNTNGYPEGEHTEPENQNQEPEGSQEYIQEQTQEHVQEQTQEHVQEQTQENTQEAVQKMTQGSAPQMPVGGHKPEKKKKNGFVKKAVSLVAAALTFGLIAGGVMIAAQKLTDNNGSSYTNHDIQTAGQSSSETTAADNEATTTEAAETEAAKQEASLTKSELGTTDGTSSVQLLDVSGVVKDVMPTVVAVTNMTVYSSTGYSFNWYGNSSGGSTEVPSAGSGVIIAENESEILIVTNAHVVIPTEYSNYTVDSFDISVTFCDDQQVDAYIKGTDEDADLAVIAVAKDSVTDETMKNIKIAAIGDSADLAVGNGVIAIGNAMGFGQSVTVGYVSALDREVTIDQVTRKLLQTDAAINPGNSGGGLFNTSGQLIGINSAKYSSEEVEGIGYAIPISAAEDTINKLMNETQPTTVTDEDKMSYLGIESSTQYTGMYDGQGAFVGSVTEGGPAEAAGIMGYDIIVGIDDKDISTWAELVNALKYYEGGTTVKITYMTLEESNGRREYVEKSTDVTLGFKKDFVSDEKN